MVEHPPYSYLPASLAVAAGGNRTAHAPTEVVIFPNSRAFWIGLCFVGARRMAVERRPACATLTAPSDIYICICILTLDSCDCVCFVIVTVAFLSDTTARRILTRKASVFHVTVCVAGGPTEQTAQLV